MERDHLNKLSITFQQWDQCEIWWQMAKWFLKNHDFIHVNSSVAGKYNKHKQDGSHLRFPIRMILATVDLQVTSNELWVNCPFGSGERFKTDFQDGRHSLNMGFPIATIWAIFHLQVTPMLPTKFRLNLPFNSEEGKNRFSGWPPSWISIGTILAIFIIQVIQMLPINFRFNWPFGSGS